MAGQSKVAPPSEDEGFDEIDGPEEVKEEIRQATKSSAHSFSTSVTSNGTRIECDSRSTTDDDASGSDPDGTVSLTSNVWKFDKENGRTYHGFRSGVYYYPNDASETERLDFQYHVIQEALSQKLHFAPLSNPQTVLDVGTGTGVWAIEMGDAYPDALIEATDLSPIQPDSVPENVQFIIDDAAEDDWAVPEGHYDFIHTRIMMGSFEDFGEIVKRGFRYTKPGGWMESQDVMHPPFCDDKTMPRDWPFREWSQSIEDAALQAGRPLRIANQLKRWYIEAGFVDVQEKVVKLPINTWPKDKDIKVLGQWWCENLLSGLQGFSLALLSRVFLWTKDEIEVYLVNVRRSMTDKRVHAYHKFYTVWGRRPFPNEVTQPAANSTTSATSQSNSSIRFADRIIAETVADASAGVAQPSLPPLTAPLPGEEEKE
ncbi:methyltransferase domain-containing protein [Phlyctema vagabunda]|uniref:Methyltransferase domain-containing protein n=1 Tax=Phlyctema vagabunda TaxID=108571 RepID=A0ABR4PQD9_9HELO